MGRPRADGVKWGRGAYAYVPPKQIRKVSQIAHEVDTHVSSGGWIETNVCCGEDAVGQYLQEVKNVGVDGIEIPTAFIMLPTTNLLRLIEKVTEAYLQAKPERRIQIGSGGHSGEDELAGATTRYR